MRKSTFELREAAETYDMDRLVRIERTARAFVRCSREADTALGELRAAVMVPRFEDDEDFASFVARQRAAAGAQSGHSM